jgi:tetratricopeptide (TPR) repeat protein
MVTVNLAETLSLLGERENNIELLGTAIKYFQSVIDAIDCKERPLLCADTKFSLGWSLTLQGDVSKKVDELKKGISIARSALDEPVMKEYPSWRAELQIEFGRLLQLLSDREDNIEPLREAIMVLSEANKVLSTPARGNEYLLRENKKHRTRAQKGLAARVKSSTTP